MKKRLGNTPEEVIFNFNQISNEWAGLRNVIASRRGKAGPYMMFSSPKELGWKDEINSPFITLCTPDGISLFEELIEMDVIEIYLTNMNCSERLETLHEPLIQKPSSL